MSRVELPRLRNLRLDLHEHHPEALARLARSAAAAGLNHLDLSGEAADASRQTLLALDDLPLLLRYTLH